MAQYIPDARFIASIFPGQLPDIRRNYGPSRENEGPNAQRSTRFHLEPVPRGKKPFMLVVYDSFENVLDLAQVSAGTSNNVQKPRLAKPVPVESIVADLLKEWTGGLHNVPPGCAPGAMEVHPLKVELKQWADNQDKIPGVPGHELEQMIDTQTRYFEYLFTEGERLHKQNNWKEITDTMRLAADWLGYEREWSHKAIARDSGPCVWCQALIPNAAIVCSHCGRQVRETPAHLLKFEKHGANLTA